MKLEGEGQQAEDLETKYSALFSPVWGLFLFLCQGCFFGDFVFEWQSSPTCQSATSQL